MYEDFPFENYYAFLCVDAKDSIAKRQAVRPQHVERLKKLQAEDRLLSAGPLLDPQNHSIPIGGLIIAKFTSLAEAQAWLAEEPYLQSGAYQSVEIKVYKNIFSAKQS